MACLSSSTHLAALITLRKYFGNYATALRVRVVLIVIFNYSLSGALAVVFSFAISGSFTLYLAYLLACGICYVFITALYVINPSLKPKVERLIRDCWSNIKFLLCLSLVYWLLEKAFSPQIKARVVKAFKSGFWYLILLGPFPIFVMQVLFATLSLGLTVAQKSIESPNAKLWCSLNSDEENAWGFGQILAMLLLLLPVLSAFETYLG
jgi:hypothetical protein